MTDVPVWGQVSLIGILFSVVVTVFILYLRGEIVPRKQLEQVQQMADTFRDAWEVSQTNQQEQIAVIGKLTVAATTLQKIADSWPKPDVHE